MSNEQLSQNGYLATGSLVGEVFGPYELLNVGATTARELVAQGVKFTIPTVIDFPFELYKSPKNPANAKPDRVYLARTSTELFPVAVCEHKASTKLDTPDQRQKAAEQALYHGATLGVSLAIATNGHNYIYIDVPVSLATKKLSLLDEPRQLNPSVLQNLLHKDTNTVRDPKPLAEKVWQIVWQATKAEPKDCLLTFVEIFVLKFLSDNLRRQDLPIAYRFDTLLQDVKKFENQNGMTAIEYYVSQIRPRIKTLFPDNVAAKESGLAQLFGMSTIVSKTSIINGFAFLRNSQQSLASYNRVFLEVLQAFSDFGPLTRIDPQFKLRLYETFLRQSVQQQALGQFFTPRNVVRQMIRMAELGKLPDGSVVLDPAVGVGGFILEPLLFKDSLMNNVAFAKGDSSRRVRTIGVDMDIDVHILAKANMLIHLAEALTRPETTLPAVNQAMANTFILMNDNTQLGSLLYPPRNSVDVILTNPPYVTKGSAGYQKEIANVKGSKNGTDLKDYYANVGLGLESFFLRYISGALKPGGKAFVIVPTGLLNRTEAGFKTKVLQECNLLASIRLPRGTFFNTSQKTYILILEKRHTEADPRPKVMCAWVRTIGESLDYRRIPTPDINDLSDVTDAFIAATSGDTTLIDELPITKMIDSSEFSSTARWDIDRFWPTDEQEALGVTEPAVGRLDFIDETAAAINQITTELETARQELTSLTSGPTVSLALSDAGLFKVSNGDRITGAHIRENPGTLPVYSCYIHEETEKGKVDEKWIKKQKFRIYSTPIITISANGVVGPVHVRRNRCAITDDVTVVEPLNASLDIDYIAHQLDSAIQHGGYFYEAKLFPGRVRTLNINIPVKDDGTFDLDLQKQISGALNRFENTRLRIIELGLVSKGARIE
ncbi:N-6 DNA methylase [Geothrix fermentans]|uniref:N-6 DNA methylase n=1 Tax=Geothrix fermentans TaxID=44676 RepID=UPI0004162C7E|nr:N-6 DNA methylase [Geothrix fermentans]